MRIKNLKVYPIKKALYEKDDEQNDILVGYEEIGTIQANIQPARGQEKVQLYGVDITKHMTVFCYPNELIEEGLFIEVEGKEYRIKPIQKWRHWTFDIEAVL